MNPAKSLFLIAGLIAFLGRTGFSQQSYDRARLTDLFQSDDYESAIDWLHSMTNLVGNPQYQSDLGYALYMNGNYAQSKMALFPLLDREGDLKANLYLARANEELERPDSALHYYRRLNRLAPRNYRYWQKTIQLYTDLALYDSALLSAQTGFGLNPGSAVLAVQYANALIRLKKAERADSVISAFLLRDTTSRDVIAKKIDLAAKKPDHKQVIFWGAKLLRDSADLTLPFISLAYSYLNSDSTDRSIYVCEWLISKNRAIPPVLYCAALAYAKKKDYVKSNEYLDKCLELSILKEATQYFHAKSDNYEEMKQYRKAASYHDTSYYIFQTPLDLYYAGRLYDKYLGKPARAAAYYKQFLTKRKRPATTDEMRIFEYINVYLEERSAPPAKK